MFRAWPHAVGWKEDLVHVRYTRQRRPELQASSYVPGRNRVTGMIASPNDVIRTGTSEATPVSLVGAHDTSTMNHGHTGIDRIEVSVPAADVEVVKSPTRTITQSHNNSVRLNRFHLSIVSPHSVCGWEVVA